MYTVCMYMYGKSLRACLYVSILLLQIEERLQKQDLVLSSIPLHPKWRTFYMQFTVLLRKTQSSFYFLCILYRKYYKRALKRIQYHCQNIVNIFFTHTIVIKGKIKPIFLEYFQIVHKNTLIDCS